MGVISPSPSSSYCNACNASSAAFGFRSRTASHQCQRGVSSVAMARRAEHVSLVDGAATSAPVLEVSAQITRDPRVTDTETVKAKAMMQLGTSKQEASLIEKQMERADTLQMGMRFRHDIHGPGEVVEILPNGKRRIQFENGELHACTPLCGSNY